MRDVLRPTLRGGGRDMRADGPRCVVCLAGRDVRWQARPGDGAIGRLAAHVADRARGASLTSRSKPRTRQAPRREPSSFAVFFALALPLYCMPLALRNEYSIGAKRSGRLLTRARRRLALGARWNGWGVFLSSSERNTLGEGVFSSPVLHSRTALLFLTKAQPFQRPRQQPQQLQLSTIRRARWRSRR